MQYTIKKYNKSGSLESEHRTGRPALIDERHKRRIKRISISQPHLSSSEISIEFSKFTKQSISPQYVRKISFKSGLRSYVAKRKPFLTKNMKKKRFNFAKKYSNKTDEFWSNVVFSDESYISINLGSIINRVRRFRSSDLYSSQFISQKVKHPTKIMI